MGSEDNGNGNLEEDKIYGYVDLFKSAGDTKPFHIYQLSMKKIKIGREQKCDIRIHNLRISRMQCCIKISGNDENRKVRLQNLTTKATTVFRNQGIPPNETVDLEDGDRFRLYDTELRFRAYNPSASNGLGESSDSRNPPIIRLVGKEKLETPEKASLYKKSPRSEKARPSRSSTRVSDRLNKSASSGSDKAPRRRKSSDIDMRRAVLQKSFRKSVQGKHFPPDIEENPELIDLEDEEEGEGNGEGEATHVDPEPMEIDEEDDDSAASSLPEPIAVADSSIVNSKDTSAQCTVDPEEDMIQLSPLVQSPPEGDVTDDLIQFHDIEREMSLLHGEDSVNNSTEKEDSEPLLLNPVSGFLESSQVSSSPPVPSEEGSDSIVPANQETNETLEQQADSDVPIVTIDSPEKADLTVNVPAPTDNLNTTTLNTTTSDIDNILPIHEVSTQAIDFNETQNLDGKSFYTAADENEHNDISMADNQSVANNSSDHNENHALDTTVSDKSDDAEDVFEDAQGEENVVESDALFEESVEQNEGAVAEQIHTEAEEDADADDDDVVEIIGEETANVVKNVNNEAEDEDDAEPEVVDIADNSSDEEDNDNSYSLDSDDGLENELIDLVDAPEILSSVDSPHEPLPNISPEDVESIPVADSPSPVNSEGLQDGITIPDGNEGDDIDDSSVLKTVDESGDSGTCQETCTDNLHKDSNEISVISVAAAEEVEEALKNSSLPGTDASLDESANKSAALLDEEVEEVEKDDENGEDNTEPLMASSSIANDDHDSGDEPEKIGEKFPENEQIETVQTADREEELASDEDHDIIAEVSLHEQGDKGEDDDDISVVKELQEKEVEVPDSDKEPPKTGEKQKEDDQVMVCMHSEDEEEMPAYDELPKDDNKGTTSDDDDELSTEGSEPISSNELSQDDSELNESRTAAEIHEGDDKPEEAEELLEEESESIKVNALSEKQDKPVEVDNILEQRQSSESSDIILDKQDEFAIVNVLDKQDEFAIVNVLDKQDEFERKEQNHGSAKDVEPLESEDPGIADEMLEADGEIVKAAEVTFPDKTKPVKEILDIGASVCDSDGDSNIEDDLRSVSDNEGMKNKVEMEKQASSSDSDTENEDGLTGERQDVNHATKRSTIESETIEVEEDGARHNVNEDETSDNKENRVDNVSEDAESDDDVSNHGVLSGGRSSRISKRKSSVSKKQPKFSDSFFQKSYSVKDCSVVLSRIRIQVNTDSSDDEETLEDSSQVKVNEPEAIFSDLTNEPLVASVMKPDELPKISESQVEEREAPTSTLQHTKKPAMSTPRGRKKAVVSTPASSKSRRNVTSLISSISQDSSPALPVTAVGGKKTHQSEVQSPVISQLTEASPSKIQKTPTASPTTIQKTPTASPSTIQKTPTASPSPIMELPATPPSKRHNAQMASPSKMLETSIGTPSNLTQVVKTPVASLEIVKNVGTSNRRSKMISPITEPNVDSLPSPSPSSTCSAAETSAHKQTPKLKDCSIVIQRLSIGEDSLLEAPPQYSAKRKSLNSPQSPQASTSKLNKSIESLQKTPKMDSSRLRKRRSVSEVEIVDLDPEQLEDEETPEELESATEDFEVNKRNSHKQVSVRSAVQTDELDEPNDSEKPAAAPKRGRPKNPVKKSETESDSEKVVPKHDRAKTLSQATSETKFVKPSPGRGRPRKQQVVSESDSDAEKFLKPAATSATRRGRPRKQREISESEESEVDKVAISSPTRGRPRNNREISESEESEADKFLKPAPKRGRTRNHREVSESKESEADKLVKPSPGRGRPRKNKEHQSHTENETGKLSTPSARRGRPKKKAEQSESDIETEADKVVVVSDANSDAESDDVPATKKAKSEKLASKKRGNKGGNVRERATETSKLKYTSEAEENESQTENRNAKEKPESPKRKRTTRRDVETVEAEEIKSSGRKTRGQARNEDVEEITVDNDRTKDTLESKHFVKSQKRDEVTSDSETDKGVLPKSKRGRYEDEAPADTLPPKGISSKGTSKELKPLKGSRRHKLTEKVEESDNEDEEAESAGKSVVPTQTAKEEEEIPTKNSRGKHRNAPKLAGETRDDKQHNEKAETSKQQEAVKLAEEVITNSSKKKQDTKLTTSKKLSKHMPVDSNIETEMPSTSRTRGVSRARTKMGSQPVVALVQLEEDIDSEVPVENVRDDDKSEDADTNMRKDDKVRKPKGKTAAPPTPTPKRRTRKDVMEEVEEVQLDADSDLEQNDEPSRGHTTKTTKGDKASKGDKEKSSTDISKPPISLTNCAQPVVLLEYMDSDEEQDKITQQRKRNRAAAQKAKKAEKHHEDSEDERVEPKPQQKRGRTRKAGDDTEPSNSKSSQHTKSKRLRRHESPEVVIEDGDEGETEKRKQLPEISENNDSKEVATVIDKVVAPLKATTSKAKRGRTAAVTAVSPVEEQNEPTTHKEEDKVAEPSPKTRRGRLQSKKVNAGREKVTNARKDSPPKEVLVQKLSTESDDEDAEQQNVPPKSSKKVAGPSSKSKVKNAAKPGGRSRHAKIVEEEAEATSEDEGEREPEPETKPEPPKVAKRGLKRTKDVSETKIAKPEKDKDAVTSNLSKKKPGKASKDEALSEEKPSSKSKSQKVHIVQKAPKDRVVLQLPETNDDDVIELSSDDEPETPASPLAKRLRGAPKVATPVKTKKPTRPTKSRRARK